MNFGCEPWNKVGSSGEKKPEVINLVYHKCTFIFHRLMTLYYGFFIKTQPMKKHLGSGWKLRPVDLLPACIQSPSGIAYAYIVFKSL
jgi:hypothetical protein